MPPLVIEECQHRSKSASVDPCGAAVIGSWSSCLVGLCLCADRGGKLLRLARRVRRRGTPRLHRSPGAQQGTVHSVAVYVDTVAVYVDTVAVYIDTVAVYVDTVAVYVDTVAVYVDTVAVYVDFDSLCWL